MAEESRYGTSLVETEALMAVMSDHTDSAEDILAEMLPSELSALADHAENLSEMCWRELQRRQVPSGTGSYETGGVE